jgi:hypothetical protein
MRRLGGSGRSLNSSISSARIPMMEACSFWPASDFSTRFRQVFVGGQQFANLNEGPDDQDIHLDGACARSTEESMATPCSMKA